MNFHNKKIKRNIIKIEIKNEIKKYITIMSDNDVLL